MDLNDQLHGRLVQRNQRWVLYKLRMLTPSRLSRCRIGKIVCGWSLDNMGRYEQVELLQERKEPPLLDSRFPFLELSQVLVPVPFI